jgi:hypothetical protein
MLSTFTTGDRYGRDCRSTSHRARAGLRRLRCARAARVLFGRHGAVCSLERPRAGALRRRASLLRQCPHRVGGAALTTPAQVPFQIIEDLRPAALQNRAARRTSTPPGAGKSWSAGPRMESRRAPTRRACPPQSGAMRSWKACSQSCAWRDRSRSWRPERTAWPGSGLRSRSLRSQLWCEPRRRCRCCRWRRCCTIVLP